MKSLVVAAVLVLGIGASAQARAQTQQAQTPKLPEGATAPPAGMCRVWLKGVQPKGQPAVTDCAKAQHDKPADAIVIYGDDFVKKTQTRTVVVTGSPTKAPSGAAQKTAPPVVTKPPIKPPGGG